MKLIKVTIDAQGYAIMEGAAEFAGAPLSVWARMILLREARSIEHRKLCVPKAAGEDYKWNGVKCTKEEYDDAIAAAKRQAAADQRVRDSIGR